MSCWWCDCVFGWPSAVKPVVNTFISFLAACTCTFFRLLHHSGLLIWKPHPPSSSTPGARVLTFYIQSTFWCERRSFGTSWAHTTSLILDSCL